MAQHNTASFFSDPRPRTSSNLNETQTTQSQSQSQTSFVLNSSSISLSVDNFASNEDIKKIKEESCSGFLP